MIQNVISNATVKINDNKRKVIQMQETMLYTVGEVAALLKCNPGRVYAFLKLGCLKCRKEALQEFLAKYEGYDISDPEHIVPLNSSTEEKAGSR